MTKVFASVEGQTEYALGVQVLQEHLLSRGVWFIPVVLKTKRIASQPAHRGGVGSWRDLRRELLNLLRDSSADLVTTMYDFYAFPSDAPGMENRASKPAGHDRVCHVERALADAIGSNRFLPYLSLHELEALVLAAPPEVLHGIAPPGVAEKIVDACSGREPEGINEETAPSKHILDHWPGYAKPLDGPRVVAAAGLAQVRLRCPHFDEWLSRLEDLGA